MTLLFTQLNKTTQDERSYFATEYISSYGFVSDLGRSLTRAAGLRLSMV